MKRNWVAFTVSMTLLALLVSGTASLAAGVLSSVMAVVAAWLCWHLFRSRRDLRTSEARKRMILEAALDCIIIMDQQGRVVEFNPAAERTFGYARAEVLGHEVAEWLVPPALRERYRRDLAHYLATGAAPFIGKRIEITAMRKGGTEFPIEMAVTPSHLGGNVLFTSYLRDITEARRAEAALAERTRLAALTAQVSIILTQGDNLQAVLQHCAEAMVEHLDAALARIWTLNSVADVLELQANAGMDTPQDGAQGRVPVGQSEIGRIAQERRAHVTNAVVGDPSETEWARREGMVAFAGHPLIVEDQLVGVTALFSRQPFSDAILDTLKAVAATIALGLGRMRVLEQLNLAKETAEEANRTKSLFLANMSHELRTPLNAVIGYSEMLQDEVQELKLDHLVPDLQKIHGAGKHLLALINDVLDLSKIEAGMMDLYVEPIEVATVVREVADAVGPLMDKKGNRLEVRSQGNLGTMQSDLTKLRQSLFNLLSNAAKFSERGVITLSVDREVAEGGDWLNFRVADSGIGISPEQLGRLFAAFSQADASTTRKFGGTGLGLAISRRFCQLMGGDISVESEMGRGSTFIIRLPAQVGAPVAVPAQVVELPSAPPGKSEGVVLVIDDDPAARDLVRRTLAKEGFRVEAAASGQGGLDLARSLHPVVIILDVMMPGMDGWAVLKALKADPELAEIPVIMVSMVDDKKLGYALGAADYLTKPVDRERLAAVLLRYRCRGPSSLVLLVEDDLLTRQMMRAMLEKAGWTVIEADNGQAAFQRLATAQPDLILLDLMMPEMDGFEFSAELRRHPEWRSIPVVVLTAKDVTAEDRRRLNGSVQRVLRKGGQNREALMQEIRELLMKLPGR